MATENRSPDRSAGCTCAVIVAPVLLAFLLAVFLFRQELFPTQSPPERLPALPAPAVQVAGFDTSFDPLGTPLIESADGQFYRWSYWNGEAQPWEAIPLPADLSTGDACPPSRQRPLDEVGSIVDCRMTQSYARWCLGPTRAFAVTEDGEVWRHYYYRWCIFPFIYFACGFVAVALVIGLILALFLGIFRRLLLRYT
jgi:hypothetical protein